MAEDFTSKDQVSSPGASAGAESPTTEMLQEQRLLRRLNMMMNMVMSVIAQDATLSLDHASQMIADARTAALAMFPGKELAWELIYQPRLQRLLRERFRIM